MVKQLCTGTDIIPQVIEYLSNRGYNRTEAMLRVESAAQDAEGRHIPARVEETGGLKYGKAFGECFCIDHWINSANLKC